VTRRFLVPPGALDADEVRLPPEESHHAAVVLRLRRGERVVVFDGRGAEALVELTRVEPREVRARVVARSAALPRAPEVQVTLAQGIPRGGKMDDVIRMGTEVGVARFVPLLTRRSLVRPSAARLARWRRIAAEAAKQSRRPTVPEVTDPLPLPALWAGEPAGPLLVPWEEERTGIGEVLPRLGPVRAVTVAVGPEGGFAPEEVAEARAHGAVTVSLGPTILRTETAGGVTVAMVLYEFGLRRLQEH